MDQTPRFDEIEIVLLLIGDAHEQEEGFLKLHDSCQNEILSSLRARYRSMDREDALDCYQEVLIRLMNLLGAYHNTSGKHGFQPDKPLLPFLLSLARVEGYRWLHTAKLLDEFIFRSVGITFQGNKPAPYWDKLDTEIHNEIRKAVHSAIEELSPRKQLIWKMLLEVSKETGQPITRNELCELVLSKVGPDYTVSLVKRALRNGRADMRRYLQAFGYPNRVISNHKFMIENIRSPVIPAPRSGQYGVVGPRGDDTGREVTVVRGEPLPPTPKPGMGYVLNDGTWNKAGRGE